ncbi:MAG: hypothetical protein JWP82_237, partial [Humibacillus sp.]|nr:hypothetical protein [Humibacillus sp.]
MTHVVAPPLVTKTATDARVEVTADDALPEHSAHAERDALTDALFAARAS